MWFLLLIVAILNAAIREKLFGPLLGQRIALPLSGIFFSILVFLITLVLVPFLGAAASINYWVVGGIWLLLTMVFEFIFGHYVMRKPWSQLIEMYNVSTGNLWVLILLVTAISPFLAAMCRGLI